MFSQLAGILLLYPIWVPQMGNLSPTRKWFSGTQSTPIRCGSHLLSGVDSVMTNPFNFDLLLFVKQVGIQNIARIIFKQSICFAVLKKQKKRRDIILWQYLFLYLRGIDPQRRHSQLFTCSTRLKNCLQEQETSAKLTCKILRVFSITIISYSCTPERMGWVEDGFEPPLLSYFLGPRRYQIIKYQLYSPGNECSAQEGIRSQQMT